MNKKDLIALIENCKNLTDEEYVNTLTNGNKEKTCEIVKWYNKEINKWKNELNAIKKREYMETVKRFKNACDKKYYVTLWQEVPYYEAAEGGYYYAGRQIVKTMSFNSRKKAIKYYAKNMSRYFDFKNDINCLHEWGNGSYNRYDSVLYETVYNSAYIGDSYGFCVTHGPFVESGKQEYC